MEYNTVRSKLLMPEYGRNVQSMAEYLLTIEDPIRRLKNAEAVIELMSILNPHLRQIEDYKHKLWDHLHQMTDFRLEVESPYPAPTAEELRKKPEPIPYPQSKVKHKHLGKNLEALMEKGLAETDEEKKQGFTQHIGYYMKLAYTNWHKEPVHDDMIKNELSVMTNGEMKYEPGGFKVHFDNRAPAGNNNFGVKKAKFNNNKGRNFANNNQSNQSSGGNPNAQVGGTGSNFNKNRKFNKNKPK